MLTSVFYYGHYKPYILESHPGPRLPKRGVQSVIRDLSGSAGNVVITKNNSIKRDVVDYADGIFRNVTEMKDSSKYVRQNADAYYNTILEESHDVAKNWAIEDLSGFANAYNAVVGFAGNQEHSAELARYGEDIQDIAEQYKHELEGAGIALIDEGRAMTVVPRTLNGLDYLEMGGALSGAAKAADAMYDRTSELLLRPLSEHMDFRQLSYYYNYGITALGKAGQSSNVSLLSGIILDRVI